MCIDLRVDDGRVGREAGKKVMILPCCSAIQQTLRLELFVNHLKKGKEGGWHLTCKRESIIDSS